MTGHATGAEARHRPVMLQPVIAALSPIEGGVFVDGTFGAGGYTRALLEGEARHVVAIDRDPEAVAGGAELAAAHRGRLTLMPGRFADLDVLAADAGRVDADGVVLDVGVSSMQLDRPERGFSFQHDGPLDMRMGGEGSDAATLVNTLDAEPLANLLYQLGEETRSRAIARAIVARRATQPFTRTRDLAEVVARAVGGRGGDRIHPATRTFQALRIAVNDELGELAEGLAAAERLLKPGGRLVVVTFHSLEDRIVKRFLAQRAGRTAGPSRHAPGSTDERVKSFQLLNHRPLPPGEEEIAANPRARSAKLRAAVRTTAPPVPLDRAALGHPSATFGG